MSGPAPVPAVTLLAMTMAALQVESSVPKFTLPNTWAKRWRMGRYHLQ